MTITLDTSDNSSSVSKIRVIVVGVHNNQLKAIYSDLEESIDIHVIGKFEKGVDVLSSFGLLNPQVIICSSSLIDMSGINLIRTLKKQIPFNRVIFCSNNKKLMSEAMRAGALDYLIFPIGHDELIKSIHRIAANNTVTGTCIDDELIDDSDLFDPINEI